MSPGELTGNFGKWVDSYVKEKGLEYKVYYDHGKKGLENVGKINGIVGSELSRVNNLAQVDILVVDKSGGINLIIEIEEGSSPNPKKVIGVVFSIILCNRFSFGKKHNRKCFKIAPETQLIFAGFTNPKGVKKQKFLEVITPRMNEMKAPSDSIRLENISFVFEDDWDLTSKALERKVKTILSSP